MTDLWRATARGTAAIFGSVSIFLFWASWYVPPYRYQAILFFLIASALIILGDNNAHLPRFRRRC